MEVHYLFFKVCEYAHDFSRELLSGTRELSSALAHCTGTEFSTCSRISAKSHVAPHGIQKEAKTGIAGISASRLG